MSDDEVVALTQDQGVLKKVLTNGINGLKPSLGQEVLVHYEGRLDDGIIFDSSYDRKQSFKFPIGEGKVIKGWDIGV